MSKNKKLNIKKLFLVLFAGTILAGLAYAVTILDPDDNIIEPNEEQYIELRATDIKEVTGQGRQVTFEVWAHNIQFNGFTFRFAYPEGLTPSNLETNEETDDELEFFKFEEEFKDYLEIFTIPYDKRERVMMAIVTLLPPNTGTEHISQDENGKGMVVKAGEELLLGQMSMKLIDGDFDMEPFELVEDEISPTTGIKIIIDGESSYQAKKSFRFVDRTASKDSTLSNIELKYYKEDPDDPDDPDQVFGLMTLDPTFDRETLNYEIVYDQYPDLINMKVTQNDETATMKIKVPSRDPDTDELLKNGSDVIYEEIEITDQIPFDITINKLGEPDTELVIEVLAEDQKTTSTYKVVIKRPYCTIKGSVVTEPTSKSTKKHKATIRIYDSDKVNEVINWSNVKDGVLDKVHDSLLKLKSLNVETNDDGTYEICVIPGSYDVLLDKAGYLDHLFVGKEAIADDTVNLGKVSLIPGDVNKDGTVQLKDLNELISNYGETSSGPGYTLSLDFNEDGSVQLQDLNYLISNYSVSRTIVYSLTRSR